MSTPVVSTVDPGAARSRGRRALLVLALSLVALLVIVLGVRHVVVAPFSVPSASMEPALQVGDVILAELLPRWKQNRRYPQELCGGYRCHRRRFVHSLWTFIVPLIMRFFFLSQLVH